MGFCLTTRDFFFMMMFFELYIYSEKYLSSQDRLEHTTFRSPMRRSNHWAIRNAWELKNIIIKTIFTSELAYIF